MVTIHHIYHLHVWIIGNKASAGTNTPANKVVSGSATFTSRRRLCRGDGSSYGHDVPLKGCPERVSSRDYRINYFIHTRPMKYPDFDSTKFQISYPTSACPWLPKCLAISRSAQPPQPRARNLNVCQPRARKRPYIPQSTLRGPQ